MENGERLKWLQSLAAFSPSIVSGLLLANVVAVNPPVLL
jgi:hypothetical protein